MDRTPVTSTDIASIGYDAKTRQLEVEFKHGTKLYTYEGVSEDIYAEFLNAKSPGRFFAANIKDKYSYTSRVR
jgi:hypothetical protein